MHTALRPHSNQPHWRCASMRRSQDKVQLTPSEAQRNDCDWPRERKLEVRHELRKLLNGLGPCVGACTGCFCVTGDGRFRPCPTSFRSITHTLDRIRSRRQPQSQTTFAHRPKRRARLPSTIPIHPPHRSFLY